MEICNLTVTLKNRTRVGRGFILMSVDLYGVYNPSSLVGLIIPGITVASSGLAMGRKCLLSRPRTQPQAI